MRLGHPSSRKLQRWLASEDVGLDRHLASCTYCADRLESLLDPSDSDIRAALLTLLTVPEELGDRIQAGIDDRMNSRNDLMLISEFFGLPFRTVRVISTTDQGDE